MIRYLVQMLGMVRNEEGQGMVEYALMLGGIAVIAVGAVALFGPQITAMFTTLGDTLNPAA